MGVKIKEFVCFIDGRGPTTVKHEGKAVAVAEARRLARSKGTRVYVLGVLGSTEANRATSALLDDPCALDHGIPLPLDWSPSSPSRIMPEFDEIRRQQQENAKLRAENERLRGQVASLTTYHASISGRIEDLRKAMG